MQPKHQVRLWHLCSSVTGYSFTMLSGLSITLHLNNLFMCISTCCCQRTWLIICNFWSEMSLLKVPPGMVRSVISHHEKRIATFKSRKYRYIHLKNRSNFHGQICIYLYLYLSANAGQMNHFEYFIEKSFSTTNF